MGTKKLISRNPQKYGIGGFFSGLWSKIFGKRKPKPVVEFGPYTQYLKKPSDYIWELYYRMQEKPATDIVFPSTFEPGDDGSVIKRTRMLNTNGDEIERYITRYPYVLGYGKPDNDTIWVRHFVKDNELITKPVPRGPERDTLNAIMDRNDK